MLWQLRKVGTLGSCGRRVALALAALVILRAAPAIACTCVPESRSDEYARATDVFVAKATSGPEPFPGTQDGLTAAAAAGGPTTRQVTYWLEVEQVLKGA